MDKNPKTPRNSLSTMPVIIIVNSTPMHWVPMPCARVTVGRPFSSKIHCIHSRNLEDMLSIIYLVNRILFITTSIFTFWQYFPRFPCKKIPIFAVSGKENGCLKKLKFNICKNRAQKLTFMHIYEPSLLPRKII